MQWKKFIKKADKNQQSTEGAWTKGDKGEDNRIISLVFVSKGIIFKGTEHFLQQLKVMEILILNTYRV